MVVERRNTKKASNDVRMLVGGGSLQRTDWTTDCKWNDRARETQEFGLHDLINRKCGGASCPMDGTEGHRETPQMDSRRQGVAKS